MVRSVAQPKRLGEAARCSRSWALVRAGLMFETGHRRPERISTAGCCWFDEDLASVLAKPDAALEEGDFEALFEMSGCVGSYVECIYFFPLALRWLRASRDKWPWSGVSNVMCFFSTNKEALSRDGLLEPSLQSIRDCFEQWTVDFEIDQGPRGLTEVRGGSEVQHFLDALLCCAEDELVSELLVYLTDSGPERAAWFLEYARAVHVEARGKWEVLPKEMLWGDPAPIRYFPSLASRIRDRELLFQQFRCVQRGLGADPNTSDYWYTVSVTLGLDAA